MAKSSETRLQYEVQGLKKKPVVPVSLSIADGPAASTQDPARDPMYDRDWTMQGTSTKASELSEGKSTAESPQQSSGASASQVVRTTIYLIDLKDFEKVNKIYAETFMEGTSPARACVEVAALPKGSRIEIDCIACLN